MESPTSYRHTNRHTDIHINSDAHRFIHRNPNRHADSHGDGYAYRVTGQLADANRNRYALTHRH